LPDTAGDPLARFHIIGCTREETLLGVVADPLVLDLRSVYLVLGAVMQAYFGRYRPAQYPPYSAVAGLRPVSRPGQAESRLGWWSRRLAAWQQPVPIASGSEPEAGSSHRPAAASCQPPDSASMQTMELSLPDDRWNQLTHAAGTAGNAGSLALIALLTQQFATGGPRHPPRFFTSTLDLRDYSDLGPVIGPLTDRIIFGVDLDGYADLTFKDLVRRAHAGLLDAVVHYMPYQDILALPSGPGASPDVTVHYCRAPPASAYTRAEESLARRGLSIELFRESELAACGPAAPGRAGHGSAMEVHVAESGPGMALVINFDARRVSANEVSGLLGGLDRLVTAVTANPEIMLSSM
jgi:hypothetical protein